MPLMSDPADTAAVEALATRSAQLAWSEDDGDDPGLYSWRPVYRSAIGIFATCIAVAGAITAANQHRTIRSSAVEAVQAGVPTGVEPSSQPSSAITNPVTLPPPGPPAGRLTPPPPVDPGADARYLARVRQVGMTITDAGWAIASAHLICDDMARGHGSEQEAAAVMRDIPGTPHFQALMIVYAAIDTYCPEYIGR